MTREEAIKILVNATFSDEWQGNEDLTTAYNMAIEALSEPTKTGTDEMWQEFESQLLREIHTPMTMDYDSSIRMAEMGIKEVLNKWKYRLSEPKTEPTTITENMTNGDVIKAMFPNMRKKGTYCEFFFDDTKAIQTNSYMHVSEHWFNAPYKGNFTMPTRPKAKWIRVDERLPEEGGDYLVTKSFDLFIKEPTVEVSRNFYCISSKKWLCDNDNVIAWMPLPEPYEAEMESEDKE